MSGRVCVAGYVLDARREERDGMDHDAVPLGHVCRSARNVGARGCGVSASPAEERGAARPAQALRTRAGEGEAPDEAVLCPAPVAQEEYCLRPGEGRLCVLKHTTRHWIVLNPPL